jgi:hypothetical protein
MERRITHDGDPRVARHLANLTLRSDRSGLRPDLDLTQAGSPISAELGAMWAAGRVIEKRVEPEMAQPGFVIMDDDEVDQLELFFGKA